MKPKLLDPKELGELLDTPYADILSMTRRGLLPHIKVGGRYYYNLSRVVAAIRERQAAEKTEAAPCA